MSESNGHARPRRYSLRRHVEPLILEDPDTNDPLHCVLREMDGTQRDEYLSSMSGRMQQKGDVQTITNFRGLHASLIAKCLHRAELELDEEGNLVRIVKILELFKEAEVQKFPSSTQAELFDDAQRMCGLNREARAEAKNS